MYALFKDGKRVGEAHGSRIDAASAALESGAMVVAERPMVLAIRDDGGYFASQYNSPLAVRLAEGYEILEVPGDDRSASDADEHLRPDWQE